ncbi:MAG TPA: flagellar motor switch protein FliN [Phycisphaerae bacterium]|nr:flagellar motor switch protein FliN [Phycisphaerae bacterium]
MDQNEIDALMGDDSGDDSPNENDSGELSQADIDAAMGGASNQPVASDDSSDAGDDVGFSQADIDALMGGKPSTSAPKENVPAAAEAPALDSEGRPLDEMGAAMAAAIAEEKAAAEAAAAANPKPADLPLEEIELPSFDQEEVYTEYTQPLSLLHDVQLHVKIELGRTRMFVEDVLRLSEGSVVELDRLAGDPVDVFVNDRLIARGEVLVLNDNFCIRVSEIVSNSEDRAAG